MDDPVNVYEAKTQLSKLLERVEAGEEITLARAGKPVAKLVPLERTPRRTPGFWAGKLELADDWDSAELNDEIAELFESGPVFPREEGAS